MELEDVKKPKLYTTHEVAVFMGIQYHTVIRLIKAGHLKVVNTGRGGINPVYTITAEAVQQYYDNITKDDTIKEDIK